MKSLLFIRKVNTALKSKKKDHDEKRNRRIAAA
jgi:hypothetical protein